MAADEPGAFEYFQRIEADFLLHRGAPLLLSPSDFRVAKGWHEAGVPLDLVLRTMEEYFERRRERSGDDEAPKVWGLRQVRPMVDAAWRRLQELTAPGERGAAEEYAPPEVAPRLAVLAERLPELTGRERWVARLEALGALEDPRRVEEGLAALEEEIVAELLAGLAPEERERLDREVERALAPLLDRMTGEEAASAGERLLRQKVRRRAGMPVLSMFGE